MFDYVAFALLLLYFAQFGVGCAQLYSCCYSRNKRLTLRNGIVTILTIASFLRVIFWTKACIPTTVSNQFGLIIFFLPVWMNFAGLSLLVVFYAQAISANGPSQLPMRICIYVNIILLVVNLVIAGELDSPDTSQPIKTSMFVAYSVYGSFLDFTLALLLGYYGYRFRTASSRSILTTRILPNSLRIFDAVNWVIVVTYCFRGVFSAILSSNQVLPKGSGDVEFNGLHPVTSATIFFFFFLAEITPCGCVFGMLWRVSASAQGKQNHVESLQHDGKETSTLDARLLSVEDSKVKVFMTATDNKSASIEDDEVRDSVYLLFEDTHKYVARDNDHESAYNSAGPDSNSVNPLIAQPIPTTYAPHTLALRPPSYEHSPIGSFSKLWGSKLSFSGSGFFKPPTPGSRDPTPDLNTYAFHHPDGTAAGGFIDGSAVIKSTVSNSEVYGNTISPRDILLHSERRRK